MTYDEEKEAQELTDCLLKLMNHRKIKAAVALSALRYAYFKILNALPVHLDSLMVDEVEYLSSLLVKAKASYWAKASSYLSQKSIPAETLRKLRQNAEKG